MMPSSSTPGPERGSPLRRWGPIAAIVAVVAIVAGIVVAGGGGDDEATGGGTTTTEAQPDGTGGGTTTPGTGGGEAGADLSPGISFSEAQAQGLDVTFSDTCDLETGRLAIPYYFAPECFANADDNGGATDDGVTADSIKVVVYSAPENDAVLDFITAAIASDDTVAQTQETFLGYIEMFQAIYQTYGRTVEIEFLNGSGESTDEVAARADAVRAVEELGAFAVVGGPALTGAWTEEIRDRGVICIACFGLSEMEPTAFQTTASTPQTNLHLAEYITKKLVDGSAEFAGDEAIQGQPRVFAHLYLETSEESTQRSNELVAALRDGGADVALQVPYTLDPARLQEQATAIIAQLKAAGVTSVIFQGDPIAPATFTAVATEQQWFPEWIIGGSALVDTTAFGRTYDQEQWAHAFGISSLGARVVPEIGDSTFLYQWFHGTPPPADQTAGVILPGASILMAAIQAAGPNLTTETMVQALYSIAPVGGSITQPSFSYGDHGLYPTIEGPDHAGIDDFTEIWWDPTVQGVLDETLAAGEGAYQYVDGGVRYLPGTWTDELRVFDPDGAIAIYEERPAAEARPDYDPPS